MEKLNIYLAGKVRGVKWNSVPKDDSKFNFVSSDGSNHSEHLSGCALFDFKECNDKSGEYAQLVIMGFIQNLRKCHALVAVLDTPDSFGSIAEISYASATAKPAHVVIVRDLEKQDPDNDLDLIDPDGMFDAYYFVCSFPNVRVYEVHSLEEAEKEVHKIVREMWLTTYSNTYKFMK